MTSSTPYSKCVTSVASPQIMYSDVVEGVKRLVSLKNSQVQPHAVLQWLTREFEVNMPQVPTQQFHNVSKCAQHCCFCQNYTCAIRMCTHQLFDWLQELCVKIDSTDSIVLLVLEIQREEELISQAIKDKMAKQTQQELQRLVRQSSSVTGSLKPS